MVTITIYANKMGLAGILNTTKGTINLEDTEYGIQVVSFKRTTKYPYELQLPLECFVGFVDDKYAKISLVALRKILHKEEK